MQEQINTTALVSATVESHDFYGQPIVTVTQGNDTFAVLGQLCDHMGLHVQAQQQSLSRQVWAKGMTCVRHVMVPGESREYPRYLINVKILGMWLASITTSRLSNLDARATIERFQVELADKIHEWLTAPTVSFSDDEIVQRALQITSNRVQALEAKVAADAPKVAEAETFRQSAGQALIGDLANALKVHAAANLPEVKILHKHVFDHAGRLGLIIRGNTVRNNQPTARAVESGWVKPARADYETNTHGSQSKQYTKLTPKGYGRLWDGCLAWINKYGTLNPNVADNSNAELALGAGDWEAAS
ncbi:phage antirepressor N-terminal domain-containing protein [Plantibacter sp. Mn2098]|uniref:phage antirepressor N-terminal domain-containing protein n=1 Tax=Plantibacter sp. Mn2098 TaxID=3395266 RepID=UPI003BB9F15E